MGTADQEVRSLSTALAVIEPPLDYVEGEYREIFNNAPAGVVPELCINIKTPVYLGEMSFEEGNVYCFEAYQKKSKTRSMIAWAQDLIENHGYAGYEVYANAWLAIPGSHWLSDDEFKKLLHRAFNTEVGKRQWCHTIWLLFDADDVYSHVTQADKVCYEDTKALYKCSKRNIYFLIEKHEGRGVPKNLRDKTEVSIEPYPDEDNDSVDLLISDGDVGKIYVRTIENISAANDLYHRFDELWG
jgi:hypothetical protein